MNMTITREETRLRLPSTYVEVTDNEMEYLDGGGITIGTIVACATILGFAFDEYNVWGR